MPTAPAARRPSSLPGTGFLEHSVQRSFSSSVKQHLLLSYNKSFAAVLRAQHAGRAGHGFPQGVRTHAQLDACRQRL